jgi:hypothetical protein
MSTQEAGSQLQEEWAVLIGINHYIPGDARRDENKKTLAYPNLLGPVHDVLLVEQYLKKTHQMPKSHILKLTATQPTDGGLKVPKESEFNRPTYENIRRVLEVTNKAKPDDFVYIHYSGHGARVKTVYPNLKGKNGLDEALAPTDVNCGGPYLRDVEIDALLEKSVKKKLMVTVVLDSCHSGGAVRGAEGAVARGLGKADFSELDTDKSALTQEEPNSLLGRYGARNDRIGRFGC